AERSAHYMRKLSFLDANNSQTCSDAVRRDPPMKHDLRQIRRNLQRMGHLNPGLELLYRGQSALHRTSDKVLKVQATLFRNLDDKSNKAEYQRRLSCLDCCTRIVREKLGGTGTFEARFQRSGPVPLWAIAQHYQLCKTPFLDVTRSLEIACSFAFSPLG